MADPVPIRSHELAEALQERDRFLLEHPELKPLQDKIDKRLHNAVSSHNRMVLIHDLMMETFLKLHENLQALAAAGRDRPTGKGRGDGRSRW